MLNKLSNKIGLRVLRSRNTIHFSIITMPKKYLFCFCDNKTLCKTHKKTHEFHLFHKDHVYKVNECLCDCFHCNFGVSTQITVHNYCIAKYKNFSAFGRFLMVLWAIFLQLNQFTSI